MPDFIRGNETLQSSLFCPVWVFGISLYILYIDKCMKKKEENICHRSPDVVTDVHSGVDLSRISSFINALSAGRDRKLILCWPC
ncbi:hypothetical protein FKM82_001812 [Ascaphus truei]